MLPDRLRTLSDLERLLAETTNYEERMPRDAARAFDLSRMERLLDAAGAPQEGKRIVHVAGSKGKGSTARMAAAILREARAPVGLYTSPHLERLTERVEVDGVEVPGDELARAAEALLPHLHATVGTLAFPTFFEVLTGAALVAFHRRGVETLVLEVGLGGRLDATNACRATTCVVTAIEREHTDLLGDTVERIAAEKAGIFDPGVPAVVGVPRDDPAGRVIAQAAQRLGAPLHVLGEDVTIEDATTGPGPVTRLRAGGPLGRAPVAIEMPVAGLHQARNAALAAAVAALWDVPADAVRRGLSRVTLPARLERVARAPAVVVDSCHTPGSARAAREALDACFPHRRLHLVVGCLEGKDLDGILAPLVAGAATVAASAVPSRRGLPPDRVAAAAARLAPGTPVRAHAGAREALAAARAAADADDLVLVAGSTYLAGEARALAREE
jgi:dihydrofolate synthase/folylpolyglutamate synthase